MKAVIRKISVVILGVAMVFALGRFVPTQADWANEVPYLQLGDEGELVAQLQSELTAISLYSNEINGVFDTATFRAVQDLQLILNVDVDGVYGPITHAAYIEAVNSGVLAPAYPNTPPLEGITIGIDAGHQEDEDLSLEKYSPLSDGLKVSMTHGSVGIRSGVDEHLINLSVAMHLKELLENAGATVVMTRTESDVSISNMERAQIMNEYHVDIWVRIHCNFSNDASAAGARILMPAGIANFSKMEASRRLGYCLINAFCDETGADMLATHALTDQTGFNWSVAPVVTIEMGYLSNTMSDLMLCRTSYQEQCAIGLYNGIIDYFNGVDVGDHEEICDVEG